MKIRERRLAIVLLDLIGSTQFVQKVGAVKAARWLQYHDRLTRSLMYRFSGREIDRSDGFLLSFEEPINAVNFALHYQLTVPPRTRLNTRVGVHVGCIAEVTQHELDVLVGAKPVELEGIAKNIAARTMSVCGPGQVLLTEEAFKEIRGHTNSMTPKGTRYVMVGLYRFKGVKEPQVIYAVGSRIEALQPPPSSEKAKRLGGPKRVRSRARDRKLKEWVSWALPRWALINIIYIICLMWPWLTHQLPIILEIVRFIYGED